MAKYIYVEPKGMWTYALDECEDYLVLDSYLHLRDSGRFNAEKHLKVFEYYHLQEGGTLNDNILLQLNGYLRQLGRDPLTFVNGHTTSYAHLRGQDKVLRRQEAIEFLRSLCSAARIDLIGRKKDEAARLPERMADLPSRTPVLNGSFSREELERRRTALANAQKEEAKRARLLPSANGPVIGSALETSNEDADFVPESTTQDNVVELIAEMHELRTEVASLKTMLQSVFRNI
jgi:hypothetical protein